MHSMYTQRTLIRVERASSVLKFCNPIGPFQYKVNRYTRIDQWDYRILKLRGHVRHESMSTGCTHAPTHTYIIGGATNLNLDRKIFCAR